MVRRERRHPGWLWLGLGFVFGVFAAFTATVLVPDAERRDSGDGLGYLVLGVLLFGAGALALVVTGVVLELKASARRRAHDPHPDAVPPRV